MRVGTRHRVGLASVRIREARLSLYPGISCGKQKKLIITNEKWTMTSRKYCAGKVLQSDFSVVFAPCTIYKLITDPPPTSFTTLSKKNSGG